MGPLRFGHPEDKVAAREFQARAASRSRLVANVYGYFVRYVDRKDWPTVDSPHGFYPKTFNRVPLSVLQEAARRLQGLKHAHESGETGGRDGS